MDLFINRIEKTEVDGLFVRPLSARHALEMDNNEGTEKMGVVLSGGLCDSEGRLIYADKEDAMRSVPWDMSWPLFEKIMQVSGLSKNAIDDAEKNLEKAG